MGGMYSQKITICSNGALNNLSLPVAFSKQFQSVKKATDEKYSEWWYRDTLKNSLDGITIAEDETFDYKIEANDDWLPLPIERETEEFQAAVDASKKTIETIEGDNGYAANEPEERNGIVETLKGTLKAIKEGAPSKEAIVSGLLKPFNYIAKKFTDAIMGASAKEAVAAIVKWLASLSG